MNAQTLKNQFLDRYNPERTLDKALSRSTSAAVQHNSLYHPNINASRKASLKAFWYEQLIFISEKYKSESRTEKDYEKDIMGLQKSMNENYRSDFRIDRHPIYNYEPGFRISHSQKSLSVFLKHLWCMDKVKTPPQCPVDRRILEIIGLRGIEANWGYINSLNIHQEKIELIRAHAQTKGFLSLAEWELFNF